MERRLMKKHAHTRGITWNHLRDTRACTLLLTAYVIRVLDKPCTLKE